MSNFIVLVLLVTEFIKNQIVIYLYSLQIFYIYLKRLAYTKFKVYFSITR